MDKLSPQLRKYGIPAAIGLAVGLVLGYLDPLGVSDPASEMREKMPDWLLKMYDQPWQLGLLGAALGLLVSFLMHQFKPKQQVAAAYSTPGMSLGGNRYDNILPASYYGSHGNAPYNPVGFDNRVPM